jgi:hypothetical protein
MTSDARLLNWRFVVPSSQERLLLLSVDHESVPDAIVPTRTATELALALREGPFTGIVVGDLVAWQSIYDDGNGTSELVPLLVASLTPEGWLYAGFPNRWSPTALLQRKHFTSRALARGLRTAGFTEIHTYFALPSQRCPAYLVSADRRAELDYFLTRLFFPYVGSASPRTARLRQRVLDWGRWTALRVPHRLRVALSPGMALVATRSA